MSQLILTRSSQIHRAIRVHHAIPLSLRVGKFFLLFSMTLLIGVLSFFYLIKFTEIHTKGYQLRRLEIEHANLTDAQETQTSEIAQAKSLASVREGAITLSMVPASRIVYVTKDSQIAAIGAQ